VLAVQQWITEQFDHGRQTSIEWEELAPLLHNIEALV
jgi:hypothetical protein